MSKTSPPEKLLDKIRGGHRFVLTSHLNPDGDAVGSALGLARILRSLGKGAQVWLHDPLPAIFHNLAGSNRVHSGAEPPPGFPDGYSGVIVLECPGTDRTGLEDQIADQPLLNIDHHLGNQHYGAVNWVDTSAPALGEMIHRLGRALQVELDAETATALYLALVSDTGGFRFANATPRAFEAGAALVGAGAQPEVVSQWLYESQPEASVRLLAEMLRSLELHGDGRVATALLTTEMFARAGATAADTEGLIDVPRSIAGVGAVALVRQVDDGRFKVSLRSRGDVDVERIAKRRGGGGHRNAAGFLAEAVLDELRAEVVSELLGATE